MNDAKAKAQQTQC